MKFSCTQENLQFGLSMIGHISGKNISLPILNNVLVRTEKGGIKLSATNLEVGITASIRGKVETEGEFTVDAKLFSDYVSLLPKENISIELKDQKLIVDCANYHTSLRGQEANEFPLIPVIDKSKELAVSVNSLKRAIQQTIYAVSNSETRPEISGAYLNVKEDKAVIVATDSYRLAEKVIRLAKNSNFNNETIIPSKTLQEILRILSNFQSKRETSAVGENNVSVYISENQMQFSFGQVELVSRIIEGQYPDYQQIIPSSHKTKLLVSSQAMLRATKAASLFTKAGINDITLNIEKGKICILSQNTQSGDNKIEIEGDVAGADNTIILNYRYLLDGLGCMDAEEIIMEITDNNTPCLVYPNKQDKKEKFRYLIMPIRQ